MNFLIRVFYLYIIFFSNWLSFSFYKWLFVNTLHRFLLQFFCNSIYMILHNNIITFLKLIYNLLWLEGAMILDLTFLLIDGQV